MKSQTNSGLPIPLSRRRYCAYCGATVDSNAESTYQYVHSWVRIRRQGAHGLTLSKRLDRYACNECIERLVKGIHPQQRTIFEAMDE